MKVNFFDFEKSTGKENMEKDLSLLEKSIQTGEFFLRFYTWAPKCVSIGRNQKEFAAGVPIELVRRPTGGRALLHDDEITYCLTGKIPDGAGVIQTYRAISGILTGGFSRLGIELEIAGERGGAQKYCMNISSGADICYRGKKFIGSAQFRKQGCFLQHGSILKSADFSLFEKVFGEKIEKEKIITLKEIAPKISDNDVIEAIKEEFFEHENLI